MLFSVKVAVRRRVRGLYCLSENEENVRCLSSYDREQSFHPGGNRIQNVTTFEFLTYLEKNSILHYLQNNTNTYSKIVK